MFGLSVFCSDKKKDKLYPFELFNIIINNGIEFENNEGDISGKIIENQANFFAFQVPFDYFTEGEDIENSIHEKILKKLKKLLRK